MVPPPANPTTSPPTPPVAPVAPPTPPPTPASPPTPAPPTAIAPISMSCCHGNGEMPLCRQDGPDGKKSIKEGATEGICPSTSVKTGQPAKRLVHVILPTVDEQCVGDGVIPGVTHCGHIPAKQWTPSKFFQDTVLTPKPNPSNPRPPTSPTPPAPESPSGGSSIKLRVPPLSRSAAITPAAPSGTFKKSKCGADYPGGRHKFRCQGGNGGRWRSTQCIETTDVQWYICPSMPKGCTGVCFCKEKGLLEPGQPNRLPKSGYYQGDCRKIKVDLSTYFVNEKATGTFG